MEENFSEAKRIVVKLGTQIVIQDDGKLAYERLANLVKDCAQLAAQGKKLLIVSSGAVGLGRETLGLGNQRLSLPEKQACAAVGQNRLMDIYRDLFGQHQLTTAQLLLTAYDFSQRHRYLNLRTVLETLLTYKTLPIINENDAVSASELDDTQNKSFGDNDKLSALVAAKLGADLLVILTNVDGIYTENPGDNPQAEKIGVVKGFEQLRDIQLAGKSTYGRGGMSSKVEAAKIATISGVDTLIASGLQPHILSEIFSPQQPFRNGTFIAAKNTLSERKRWLGLASGYEGVVLVNSGARLALTERFASLLPSGIIGVEGDFLAKQVVSIQDEAGEEIGRGLINFSAEETRKIQGHHSQEISKRLGNPSVDEVIHRDNLVIFQEYQP